MTNAQKLLMIGGAPWLTRRDYPKLVGGLEAWFDETDPSSMIMDFANRVSLIADKSGNSSTNVLCLNGVAGNYASAPDSAAVSVTGDIDVRWIASATWTGATVMTLGSKNNGAGNISWKADWASNVLTLQFSSNGTATTGAASDSFGLSDYQFTGIRFTRASATGTCTFYKSTDGTTWSQVGATKATTAGDIFDGNAILSLGALNGTSQFFTGLIYRAQIYNGIAGTLAFDANFALPAKLAPSFTESSSNAATVTINTSGATGARISGARDLYQGTAANQPIYLPWSGTNYGYLNGVAANWFSTPDSASAPTGDIDIQLFIAAADWTPAAIQLLCDKWGGAGQRSWTLRLNTAGTLSFFTSADGTASTAGTSSVAPTVSDGGALWIRVTRASGTGAIIFYTGGSAATPTWVQLGTSTSNTAGAIFDSTATVTLGADSTGSGNNFAGLIYYASISSSIGGAAAIAFDASRYTSGTTFTASTGEVWTINGGATIVTRSCLYLDGSNDYLKAAAFALAQPETVYFVGSQVTWMDSDVLFDGNGVSERMFLAQPPGGAGPQLAIYAGSYSGVNSGLATATRGIVSSVFNNASSFVRINRTAATTGTTGTQNGNGFTLGAAYNAGASANITAQEVVVYSGAHDTATQDRVIRYLARKHRLPAV